MNEYYRVEDFTGSSPMLVKSSLTLKQLLILISQQSNHKNNTFTIYYHWAQLPLQEYQLLTLKEIVLKDPIDTPIFYICDDVTEQEINPQYKEIYQELKNHLYVDENDKKSHWYGSNGHMLLDNRNLGLLASSIKHASNTPQFQKMHGREIGKTLKESLIMDETEEQLTLEKIKAQTTTPNIFKRLLMKVGLMKQKPTHENLYSTVLALKKASNQQTLSVVKEEAEKPDYQYTDFDPKFATYLQRVYIKFAIKSSFKLHYVEYKSWEFGVIKKKFPNNAKIGLIGDYGTGLADSIRLLQHMIIVKKVDVIIHLGDVYYAGTPQEYENNITKPLNELRTKVKRQIIFYSIPGNHDYYSWGLPFLCFIKEINKDTFVRQQASYFCLRNEDETWQFLGADTAYHDSDPVDQLSVTGMGPRLRHKQMSWHRQKLQNFKGSTILLSHHQLFSIHDRICGSLSAYRNFSCLNPLLSSQLFEYMPYVSCWFWGHEHAVMFFSEDILGAHKCRLLGNSSFHVVYEKEHPYQRKKGFPYIPFVCPDNDYKKKYLPLSPIQKQLYFNLTYGFIDMAQSSYFGLNIEYMCCPSFSEKDKNKKQFEPYLLYKQVLHCREVIQKRYKNIKNESNVYIKMETGLLLTYDEKEVMINTNSKDHSDWQKSSIGFSLVGKPFIIQLDDAEPNDREKDVTDQSVIHIKTQREFLYLQINTITNKIFLTPKKSINTTWKITKNYIMRDQSPLIKFRNTIKLQHPESTCFMSWKMDETPRIAGGRGKIGEAVFMFLEQSVIQNVDAL